MDDESQISTRLVVEAILSDEVVERPKIRRLAFARQFFFGWRRSISGAFEGKLQFLPSFHWCHCNWTAGVVSRPVFGLDVEEVVAVDGSYIVCRTSYKIVAGVAERGAFVMGILPAFRATHTSLLVQGFATDTAISSRSRICFNASSDEKNPEQFGRRDLLRCRKPDSSWGLSSSRRRDDFPAFDRWTSICTEEHPSCWVHHGKAEWLDPVCSISFVPSVPTVSKYGIWTLSVLSVSLV